MEVGGANAGTKGEHSGRMAVSDLFSDDSSFYGNSENKADLELRAIEYNPSRYWDVVQWNIQCLASRTVENPVHGKKRKRENSGASPSTTSKTSMSADAPPSQVEVKSETSVVTTDRPYNPFEGEKSAKQLSESLGDFLTRLKPSTTSITTAGPWIWIANPVSTYRPTNQNMTGFKQKGSNALDEYLSRKSQVEQANPNKTQGSITRMLKPDRNILEGQIVDLAKQYGVTSGKWMLFQRPDEVDDVWNKIARAVLNNELGCSAKVATDDGDPSNQFRLICVYTLDFSDKEDVKRVLSGLCRLGLLIDSKNKERTIYYKSDAYTHLDLVSGNEYKLKTSMYNSNDFDVEKV